MEFLDQEYLFLAEFSLAGLGGKNLLSSLWKVP